MTDSLYQGFGGLSLPVSVAGTETTLTSLDQARATLAALFKAAINAELGALWTLAAADSPLAGSSPCQATLELAPTAQTMKQWKATGWPLLCIYRDGSGVLEQHTLNGQIERLTQPWGLDYILGPVDIGDLRKLGDIFQAVTKVVRLCIRKRGHPAYQSGALQFFPNADVNGDVPLFPEKSLLGSIELKSVDGPPHYQARFAGAEDSLSYFAISMHLETVEYTYDDAEADPNVEAADFNVAGGGSDGTIADFVIAKTDAQNF